MKTYDTEMRPLPAYNTTDSRLTFDLEAVSQPRDWGDGLSAEMRAHADELDRVMSTEGPDMNNDCQSGPSDLAWERRERDRSGTKPKKRKWKDREKAKAARKARKANR